MRCPELTLTGRAADATSITGIAIGPFEHILVSACGYPIVLTRHANGTFTVISITDKVGGGDEVWYNPGDGRFYVTAPVPGAKGAPGAAVPPATTGAQQLGVIDAEDGSLLQVLQQEADLGIAAAGTKGKNPAAFAENNHIFTIQSITAGIAAGTSADDSVCAKIGFVKTGCVTIFEHAESH